MKFYLDEDLPPRIAGLLRSSGFDAVSASEVGSVGRPDADHLARAAREHRCLVTRNARDFMALARDAVRSQTPHAGIIVFPPSVLGFELRMIVDRLAIASRLYPRGLGPYTLIYLP